MHNMMIKETSPRNITTPITMATIAPAPRESAIEDHMISQGIMCYSIIYSLQVMPMMSRQFVQNPVVNLHSVSLSLSPSQSAQQTLMGVSPR